MKRYGQKSLKLKVVLYRRYAYNIICLFACKKDANQFFTFLSYPHPNIKFTFEREKDNKIAFFDI